MKLSELITAAQWPFGLILDDEALEIQALLAVRQYMTWGTIASLDNSTPEPLNMEPLFSPYYIPTWQPRPYISYPDQGSDAPPNDPCACTEISFGEWGVIKPLFMLYVERANATALEASRVMGVDVFGRSVDSIENDITRYEQTDMPRLAFSQDIVTV